MIKIERNQWRVPAQVTGDERVEMQKFIDERIAEEDIFEEEYRPLIDQIEDMIMGIPYNDLCGLGLDHVGGSCPPN